MKPQLQSLSEEVVRWGYEVSVQFDEHRIIAFTNPTAGPWKRIICTNALGESGEIYRFEREETRPDLIIVNDLKKTVTIIEAKTTFEGIENEEQISKTGALFDSLSKLLKGKGENPYWGERSKYEYQLGLLWGGEVKNQERISSTVIQYLASSKVDLIDAICIEGIFLENNLIHKVFSGTTGLPINDY